MKFSGVIPPIITPLAEDGQPDLDSLCRLIDFEITAGVDGLFVLGSSGEAIYLDDEQRRMVAETATEHIAGRVKVLVGALDATVNRVIAQIRLMDGIEVDAYVVTAPFYANPSPNETSAHFRTIAASTPTPIVAYDIPGNVGRTIGRDVTIALLQDGTIAALKDSTGALSDLRRIIDASTGLDCSLLTGSDLLADLALALGADGLIPGLANIRPDLFIDLIEATRAGRGDEARTIQSAINRLVDVFVVGESFGIGKHSSELGALKSILADRGVIACAEVSPPLQRLPAEALEEVRRIYSDAAVIRPVRG